MLKLVKHPLPLVHQSYDEVLGKYYLCKASVTECIKLNTRSFHSVHTDTGIYTQVMHGVR